MKTQSCLSCFLSDHAFENDFDDGCKGGPGRESEFLHLRRIHRLADRHQKNLDHDFCRNIFAHHSRALTLDKKFSKKMSDQLGAPALNRLEHVRRLLPHVANEWWLDLIQLALGVSEQLVQRSRKIVSVFTRDLLQLRLDTGELIRQHCLEHRHLVWEMDVEGLFANAQFRRQIIHRHPAKSMTKEMRPSSVDDALTAVRCWSAPSNLRFALLRRLFCAFGSHDI